MAESQPRCTRRLTAVDRNLLAAHAALHPNSFGMSASYDTQVAWLDALKDWLIETGGEIFEPSLPALNERNRHAGS